MLESPAEPITSLYVHVPFCAQKCAYCAFYSEPSGGDLINRYIGALVSEMELVAGDLKPVTVFFGGGTPSLLNLRQWEQLLQAMERLNLLGAAEWTVECNPATVSLDKAKLLRSWGVNRISMGVQSLNEDLLDRLGRIHSRAMVFKSFDILRQAGFDNLNLDLMFAIPGQTLEVWRETLGEAVALGSEHLSSYEVIYEEDTALYSQLKQGRFAVDEDLACAMYEELVKSATRAGFQQYEVANFAKDERPGAGSKEVRSLESEPRKSHRSDQSDWSDLTQHGPRSPDPHPSPALLPSRACRHNVNYWRGGSFYGLGPSATSYLRGVRSRNWSNTRLYCERLEKGQRASESEEQLPPLARAGETAAFGLRMVGGWPFEEFKRATGHDLRGEWAAEMGQLSSRGWGTIGPDGFRLTRAGLRFADAAAELFLR